MPFESPKRILVTGGAGYIGSHMALRLAESGYSVTIVDNCFRGHVGAVDALRKAVPNATIAFEQLSIHETDRLAHIMRENQIDAVIHFAALAYVGESVERPLDYWWTNLGGTLSLLKAMDSAKVGRLIFSSTCATYGVPTEGANSIDESCPQNPINPYGAAKLAAEHAIADHQNSILRIGGNFAFAALRYFNVIGSDPHGRIGEDHRPESHLVPSCLLAVLGRRDPLCIMGDDYPTSDGTCVRDYVDVGDLCAAHLAALNALTARESLRLNVGTGRGQSVLEILQACERVCQRAVPALRGARRDGDPPMLVANAAQIQRLLRWAPAVRTLDESIGNAWKWMSSNPNGYG